MDVRPSAQAPERLGELLGRGCRGLPRREEDDVLALRRQPAQPRGLPQDTLGAIANHRVPDALRTSEGDPARIAFTRRINNDHAHQGVVVPTPPRIHPLEVQMRFDGPHASVQVTR